MRNIRYFELIEQIIIIPGSFAEVCKRHIRVFVGLALGIIMRGHIDSIYACLRTECRLRGIIHIDIQTVLVLTENIIRITILYDFENLRRTVFVFGITRKINVGEVVLYFCAVEIVFAYDNGNGRRDSIKLPDGYCRKEEYGKHEYACLICLFHQPPR